MRVVGVIPARYKSTRFPGKPLVDICGKPMIWWVYHQANKSNKISEWYVLTDDERIYSCCLEYGMNCLITKADHPNHISRVHEASTLLQADCYVCINGDEPLIEPSAIDKVIPDNMENTSPVFEGAARKLNDAAKVIDPANIKLILTHDRQCLYMSRSPIPFPKGNLNFDYYKYVGIECFNKSALDYFVSHTMGELEKTEDIDHLRFLENNIPIYFSIVNSESISVDTVKDLEYVKSIITEKIKFGEIMV